MSVIYRHRDAISFVPGALLAAALVFGGFKNATSVKPKEKDPVQVALINEQDIPPPPPPEVKQPTPPQPQEQPQPTPTPEPVRTPTPTPSPIVEPIPTPVPQPAKPVEAKPVEAPPPAPAPAPRPVANVNAGDQYAATLRQYLESHKRIPTGREYSSLRPEGRVEYFVVLDREGNVKDMGILNKPEVAGATLLVQAAKDTIKRAKFPPFPADAWPNDQTHRFEGGINYTAPAE
ncbi:energy transducer TonB [Burkholderiaceae bacterium DAT-1]|nr:energy transducer TonB [Burkholderiaceae bacterium DAT-1]